jgi:hypothetical protein
MLNTHISSLDNNTGEQELPGHATNYNCTCGYCRNMPTAKEEVCCKEKKNCRAKSMAFHNICIESDNLSTAIWNMADTMYSHPLTIIEL